MNRSPALWNEPRRMNHLSRMRKEVCRGIKSSSFANVALSHRIGQRPERFLASTMQTYWDIVRLTEQMRQGLHPCFHEDVHIDLFGYSIGCFLAELLLMADPKALFSRSRLCMFCGGAAMLATNPESKSILDSHAKRSLDDFFYRLLEDNEEGVEQSEEMLYFRSLLHKKKLSRIREKRIKELTERLLVLALKKDEVVPFDALKETLQGNGRNIAVPLVPLDFAYPHTHQEPFPLAEGMQGDVEESFSFVFQRAADFFS
jgi:hypothetical protein